MAKIQQEKCLEKSFTASKGELLQQPLSISFPAAPTPSASGHGPACFSHYYLTIYSQDRGELKFVDIPRPRATSNTTLTPFSNLINGSLRWKRHRDEERNMKQVGALANQA